MSRLLKMYCAPALLFFLIGIAYRSYAGSDTLTVNVNWLYENFPKKVELYEVDPENRLPLWRTESVAAGKALPVGERIEGGKLVIKKGSRKWFVLAVKNDTEKPLYFFAAPHVVEPPAYSLGFKFKCLCINHAYSVGAGETWYRVVQLIINDNVVGDTLDVTHSIIGIDKKRMENFKLKERLPSL